MSTPDGLARGEQVVAVPDPAAEVEHRARRQERLGERVAGRVALPGGVEAALRVVTPARR